MSYGKFDFSNANPNDAEEQWESIGDTTNLTNNNNNKSNNNTSANSSGSGSASKPTHKSKLSIDTAANQPKSVANDPLHQPLQSPSPTAGTKRKCAYKGCTSDRFARGYCSIHLPTVTAARQAQLKQQQQLAGKNNGAIAPLKPYVVPAPPTPTTKIRSTYNLWSRIDDDDSEASVRKIKWDFVHGDDQHIVELTEDLFVGLRCVVMNNVAVYNGLAELGYWTIDAQLGMTMSSSCNARVEVSVTEQGYKYELYVEDLPFDQARNLFLSKLAGLNLSLHTQNDEKHTAIQEKDYINKNWGKQHEKDKTSLGYQKSRLTWRFTISGKKHVVVVEHSHTGGKKTIWLDGHEKYMKKPGILSNKQKPFKYTFEVDDVPVTVTILPKSDSEKLKDKENKDKDKDNSPFVYDLLIDNVPFNENTLSEIDRAGGDLTIKSDPNSPQMANKTLANNNNGTNNNGDPTSPRSPFSPRSVAGFRSDVRVDMTAEDIAELQLVGENGASDD